MSSSIGGSSSGITEKLEHSTLLDLLQIGVYAYFGFVAYNNLGFNKDQLTTISSNSTVIAVQLAAALILINAGFVMHDKIR